MFLAGSHGTVLGLFRFLGGIIIHYRSHRSFSTLTRRFFRNNNNGRSFGYSFFPFFLYLSSHHHAFGRGHILLLAQASSLRNLANTPGGRMFCRPRFVESTDYNHLGVDFVLALSLSRLALFVLPSQILHYYTIPPPLYRLEGRAGLGDTILVLADPAITCCRRVVGVFYSFLLSFAKTPHYTYHIPFQSSSLPSSGFSFFLMGGRGRKEEAVSLVFFTSVLSFIIDIATTITVSYTSFLFFINLDTSSSLTLALLERSSARELSSSLLRSIKLFFCRCTFAWAVGCCNMTDLCGAVLCCAVQRPNDHPRHDLPNVVAVLDMDLS